MGWEWRHASFFMGGSFSSSVGEQGGRSTEKCPAVSHISSVLSTDINLAVEAGETSKGLFSKLRTLLGSPVAVLSNGLTVDLPLA